VERIQSQMKTLADYLAEADEKLNPPTIGDNFSIELEDTLLESYIVDVAEDGYVIAADDRLLELLEGCGCSTNEDFTTDMDQEESEDDQAMHSVADAGEFDYEGDMAKDDLATIVRAARKLTGMLDDNENMPEWVQSKINKAADYVDTAADYIESNKADAIAEGPLHNPGQEDSPVAQAITRRILMQRTDLLSKYGPVYVGQAIDDVADSVGDWDEIGSSDVSGWVRQVEWNLKNKLNQYDVPMDQIEEAEYRGRKVPLGKPMKGDVKKSKVYVKKPNGNVVKVEFGDKKMRIKKHIPGRRKNFRARHNCDNPGPRWKARYWSCRAW
jgi:hypothetical protein